MERHFSAAFQKEFEKRGEFQEKFEMRGGFEAKYHLVIDRCTVSSRTSLVPRPNYPFFCSWFALTIRCGRVAKSGKAWYHSFIT